MKTQYFFKRPESLTNHIHFDFDRGHNSVDEALTYLERMGLPLTAEKENWSLDKVTTETVIVMGGKQMDDSCFMLIGADLKKVQKMWDEGEIVIGGITRDYQETLDNSAPFETDFQKRGLFITQSDPVGKVQLIQELDYKYLFVKILSDTEKGLDKVI